MPLNNTDALGLVQAHETRLREIIGDLPTDTLLALFDEGGPAPDYEDLDVLNKTMHHFDDAFIGAFGDELLGLRVYQRVTRATSVAKRANERLALDISRARVAEQEAARHSEHEARAPERPPSH